MVQPSVAKYLRKECSDLNEVAPDDDDKGDDDANSKDVEVAEISPGETPTMLDRSAHLKHLSKEKWNSLVPMKD